VIAAPGQERLGVLKSRVQMSVRFVVEGTVYVLAAREAMALARALRLRAAPQTDFLPDAVAAAILIETALDHERPAAVRLTAREAAEIVRVARRRKRPFYAAAATVRA